MATTLRQAIEDRIRDQVSGLREVAGAADLQSVLAGRITPPAAFVFRVQTRAGENSIVNGVDQRVTETYAVVIVTRNVRDPRGADSSDDNEALASSVSTALLGWQPASDADPLEYDGGRLLSLSDGFLFWQEAYRTARYRRA